MALVLRGDRPYWYRSVRRGDKVTSEYVACGRCALMIAGAVEDSAWERRWERQRFQTKLGRLKTRLQARVEAWRAERRRLEAEDREFATYFDQVESIARAALLASGFHQHHRGEWRRRSMPESKDLATAETPSLP